MALPPAPRGDSAPGGLPERRLTPEQMERVIRRAVELQAGASDRSAEEGITETELVRIGREIGVSPQYIQRALAETGAPATTPALAERVFGPGWVRAERTVPGSAEEVAAQLDHYLTEREWLAPVRRFPGRTTYAKARGGELVRLLRVVEDVAGTRQPPVGAGFKLKEARQTEVAVQPLEEGYAYVSVAVDLTGHRTGWATVGSLVGGGGALTVATALGIAIDPAAALLGLPVLGGGVWGARAIQLAALNKAQTHLESILDCMERGEPLVRARGRRG